MRRRSVQAMLLTIYTACPRGHNYRTGRFTPGLLLRIKGECPVCRDYQITSGLVTPFVNEVVPVQHLHHLTTVTSDLVRRQLVTLSHRTDVSHLLDGIPRDPTFLNVRDVLRSMEVWMQHRGRPGGAIPERHHTVEVLNGTNDPQASIAYLRDQRRTTRDRPVLKGSSALVERLFDWMLLRAVRFRNAMNVFISSIRREIAYLQARFRAIVDRR